MEEFGKIEDFFVRRQLYLHGDYVLDLLRDSIKEKNLRVTDDLLDSLKYQVHKKNESEYVLEISFLSYGRAVEIQYFKSKQKRREQAESGQRAKDMRRAKKKDTRFYAKNVYGSLNRLIGKLGSEYTEQEKQRIKNFLEREQ